MRWFNAMVFSLLLLACAIPASMASDESFSGFDTIADLPPGEQFRQLSLMLLMASKTGPEFISSFAAELASTATTASNEIMPNDYRTPLVRIVDQESMVDSAVRLFGFVQDNLAPITENLTAIKADHPVLISMVDTNEIMEDAIIIRNAVADSILYLDYADGERTAVLLGDYRVHTVFLRNQVEFAEFYQELEKITDAAVNSVGGRMDAYQRMFDEEFATDSVGRFMEATEFNREERVKLDRRAAELTEEILQNVMDEMYPSHP